jgi:D-sedoheptulose 7-phosphate isomerase
MSDFIPEIDRYIERLKDTLDRVSRPEIAAFMDLLLKALDQDRQVLIMGNGGSAATASHFACDFNKGLSYGKKKRFRFICLNDNLATLSAYANDVGYEQALTEILKNFLRPGDLVVAISGSGNSPNVVRAVEYANANDGLTVGITGYDGGALRKAARHGVHVPIADMQVTEDIHMVLDHLLYAVLARHLK